MSRQKKFYLSQRKPSGIYYYIVSDPITRKTTAYLSTGTTDRNQAELIGMEWWANGLPDKPKTGIERKKLLCDYLYDFWDFSSSNYFRELEIMGKKPHPEHALQMRQNVDRHFRQYFNDLLLCQLDEETLQDFIVYLKIKKNLAASSINSIRNTALVALRYAKRKKMIKRFDFDVVLRAVGDSKERGVLENNEVEKLLNLNWNNKKAKLIVLISLYTGMRISEVRSLRLCDIHENKLSVKHSWASISKLKSTKNNETKEVPIMPFLYNEIMAYIRYMGYKKLDGFIFPGKKPEIPYDSKQIRNEFYKMLDSIGINEDVRKERNIVMHSFRHRMAKTLVENGISKKIGKQILGVKTDRIFEHYSSGVDAETFKKMTEAIAVVSQLNLPKEPIQFKREAG